jgi:methionyl-tRNA synthetase
MYLITTPIPYTNSEPHIGHLLEAIYNDTVARYRRRVESGGVILTMGVDQHGLKNQQVAEKLGISPEAYALKMGSFYENVFKEYDVYSDVFVQTHSREHTLVCSLVWKKLKAKNLIYKKSYQGLYCVGCEDFYAPSQLDENGNCPVHQTKPIEMKEENYFFKLSSMTEVVVEFLNNAKIYPESVRKEWQNFVAEGLSDISISREKSRLNWGVDVPDDNQQVMYVWFEALINYLTAVVNPESIDRYFEQPLLKTETEEVIWKDIAEAMPIDFMYISREIAKFHLVIFIAILSGLELPLPQISVAHGLINDKDGRKMSKTIGNVVKPQELRDKFGVDGTRYLMLAEINIFSDSNFDWDRMIDSYNANLADNLGNLVVRVSNLVEKFLDGQVDVNNLEESDFESLKIDFSLVKVYQLLENFQLQSSLSEIFSQTTKLNQMLEQTKPWSIAKNWEENGQEVRKILTLAVKCLIETGKCLSIFMPESGDKIYQIFTAEKISKAQILFPKIET